MKIPVIFFAISMAVAAQAGKLNISVSQFSSSENGNGMAIKKDGLGSYSITIITSTGFTLPPSDQTSSKTYIYFGHPSVGWTVRVIWKPSGTESAPQFVKIKTTTTTWAENYISNTGARGSTQALATYAQDANGGQGNYVVKHHFPIKGGAHREVNYYTRQLQIDSNGHYVAQLDLPGPNMIVTSTSDGEGGSGTLVAKSTSSTSLTASAVILP